MKICSVYKRFFVFKYKRSQGIEAEETENYHKLYPRRFIGEIFCVPHDIYGFFVGGPNEAFQRSRWCRLKKIVKYLQRRLG